MVEPSNYAVLCFMLHMVTRAAKPSGKTSAFYKTDLLSSDYIVALSGRGIKVKFT